MLVALQVCAGVIENSCACMCTDELTTSSAVNEAPGSLQSCFVDCAYVRTACHAKGRGKKKAMYKITASLLVHNIIWIILHDIHICTVQCVNRIQRPPNLTVPMAQTSTQLPSSGREKARQFKHCTRCPLRHRHRSPRCPFVLARSPYGNA